MFPTPHTVTRHPYMGDSEDSLGNTEPVFAAPVSVAVYAIAPHTVEHGAATLTETQVADVDVFMPETAVNLKDRFDIDNDTFEVVGVQDWTKGFHGWPAGIVVELQRVT